VFRRLKHKEADMPREKKVKIKIVAASDVTEAQIANGDVGSAYSNAEVELRNSLSRNDGRFSQEAELLQADLDAELAAMTETERLEYQRRERASARREQSKLAKEMGVPFDELDGIFGYYFKK
jgi:hypothetical protein